MSENELVRVPHGYTEEGADTPRYFTSFTCYKLDPSWRRLPAQIREEHKAEFAKAVDAISEEISIQTYTSVGIRPDMDLMTWRATPSLELINQSQTILYETALGTYLEPTYLYTATTKGSEYIKASKSVGFSKKPLKVTQTQRKYFIVYPFVKKREWYKLPAEERGRMMREHAMIGREWPGVKLNTAYSFGIDDQEFMTAFETDSVHDFLDLMMALRGSDASAYTERDTPIFTCLYMPVREALDTLGGVSDSEFIFTPDSTVLKETSSGV